MPILADSAPDDHASDRYDTLEDLSGRFADTLLDLVFGPRIERSPGDGASTPSTTAARCPWTSSAESSDPIDDEPYEIN